MTSKNVINSNFHQIAKADSEGNVSGVTIADIADFSIAGGSNGQTITTDGNGVMSWSTPLSDQIQNGNSNVIVYANSDVAVSSNGQANIVVVSSNSTHATTTVTNDMVITGNLVVDGNTSYVNITDYNVEDPVISLGGGPNGQPLTGDDGKDRGVALKRYGNYHEYLATAAAAPGDTTITLNTVADLTIGQVLTNPSLVIGTVVTNITGLVVTLSAALIAPVAIGDKFTYGADITGFMGWDSSANTFVLANSASITDNLITINTYGNLQAQTVNADYFQGIHRGATQDLAVNQSGAPVSLGQVVFVSGAQGNRIAFKLAQANTEANSVGTFGFVTSTINNNAEGYIQTSGTISGLNTFGLTAGAPVYLSPTVAGGWTTTKPVAPQHTVVLGWIERVHATLGSIYVKVDNGYELDELHNVKITYYANANANANLMNGHVLSFDSANAIWINRPTKMYTDEFHVDPVNGVDAPTQSGSYEQPFLTITYALSRMASSGQTLVLHDGSYPEAVNITKTNIEIQGTTNTGGLVLLTGAWTFANTSSSVRCWSLNWGPTGSISITGAGSVYFRNCINSGSVTKSGGGYVQLDECDFAGTGFTVTGAGTVLVQQSMLNFPTINNSSAIFSVLNSPTTAVATVTSGTALFGESFVYSANATANAITTGAGGIVYLYNTRLATPIGTLARVNFGTGFWSINDTQFDRANSNLAGTCLNTTSQFDAINVQGNLVLATGPNSNVFTSTSDLEINSSNVVVRKSAYPIYQPVLDNTLSTPPATPAADDRYLVAAAPTGAWSTFVNQIVTWSGSAWVSSGAPAANDTVVVTAGTNAGRMYTWNGTAWTINAQPQDIRVTPWALNAAYPTGAIVLKDSVFYQAAGNIAANTAFATGVSGARWKAVGGSGSANAIINGNSNVTIATSGGNITMGVANIANVVVVSGSTNTNANANTFSTTTTSNLQGVGSFTRNTVTNTVSNTTVVTSSALVSADQIELVANGGIFANAANLRSTVTSGNGNVANTSFLVTGTNANSMFYAQSQSVNANANIYMAAVSVNQGTRVDVRALGSSANANTRIMIEAIGANAGIVLAASGGSANANVLTVTPANVTFGNTTVVKYGNVANVATADAGYPFYPIVLDQNGNIAKQPVVSSLSPVIDNTLTDPPPAPNFGDAYLLPTSVNNVTITARVATTTTLFAEIGGGLPVITYNNGTNGVGATLTISGGTLTALDGVTLTTGMRILVKNEISRAHNGVYSYTSSTVLTRVTDFDTAAEMIANSVVQVDSGTLQGNTRWLMANAVTTVGTSAADFAQTTNTWYGNANKIATWTGSEWSFYTPAVNDQTSVLTGVNAGNAYLWNGTLWNLQSVNTTLPLSNWTLGAAYTAGSLVVYQNGIYQANGAVAANTAFVIGTTGATWRQLNSFGLAENGSQNMTGNNLDITNTTANLVTFTLPTPGTWEVTYNVSAESIASGSSSTTYLTNSTGGIIANSYSYVTYTAGGLSAGASTRTLNITTTTANTVYRVVISTSGSTRIYPTYTGATWNKIAGFVPTTGVTTAILKATRTTTQSITSGTNINVPVICGVIENQGGTEIAYNSTTGTVTLQAGNTYRLRGAIGSMISTLAGQPASAQFQWRNTTTGAFVGGTGSQIAPGASNTNSAGVPVAEVVITPSTTTTLQLWVSSMFNATGIGQQTSGAESGYPWIDVQQLGTTNTSAFTGMISTGYTVNNTYPAGTIVVRDGFLYQANGVVPAGTSFVIGTTGATWTLLNLQAAENGAATAIVANNTTITTSTTSPTKVLQFDIPTAGTWTLSVSISAGTVPGASMFTNLYTGATPASANIVANTTLYGPAGSASGVGDMITTTWTVTTTGAATYSVGSFSTGSTVVLYNSSALGFTRGWYNKVSGFLPLTGKVFTEQITIGATTTAPTKATARLLDYITITDDNSGWCDVEMAYHHNNAAGSAGGSGAYLFSLPAGYAFDTTVQPLNTQVTLVSGDGEPYKMIPSMGLVQTTSTYSAFSNYAMPHTATQFKIVAMNPTNWAFVGAGYFQINAATITYKISFRFKKA